MIKKLIKDIIKGERGFNKGEGISSESGVVGGYTMLIITDLRIHLPPPPTGTPPSRRRRIRIAPTSRSEFLNLLFTIIHL